MQLSVFEMVKKGVSTIIEVVDAFAREQINELDTFARKQINQLNINLNTKQNITDNNLVTNSKEIVGAINELDNNLTSYTDHATQTGTSNTPMIANTDSWFCVYGRSANGNFVEVLDGASPMWSGFLYSDGNNGSCSPLLMAKAGHTYTLNVVSGGSYDTHFVTYR